MAQLAADGCHSVIREVEPGLMGVGSEPGVGVGQRGLVVQTAEGNLLWDPAPFLDDAAIEAVRAAGGLRAVSASHPHMYGAAVEWSHAFDAELLLVDVDAAWLMRPDPAVRTWSGELEVLPGVTLVQCGGHFPASSVAHWAAGAEGRGAILAGDTIMVTPGEDRVSFVYSAPVRLPLAEPAVTRHRGGARALRLRPHLRRLVEPGRPPRRQGRHAALRRALHRAAHHGGGAGTAARRARRRRSPPRTHPAPAPAPPRKSKLMSLVLAIRRCTVTTEFSEGDYDIHLDDKFGHLAMIDIDAEAAAHEPWFNQTLTTVNDSVVRLGVVEGEFHWHKHDDTDEFFMVLDGELVIDIEDRDSVRLSRHQSYTVPRTVMHRTSAPGRTVILMVEAAGVTPTGDDPPAS